ncbi:MAG TPA: hypothetical protein VFQ65_30115 [Kofleriaceae bacterium]|nr:hypothetical protein [Kofleriaceae bacterium]
MLRLPLRRIVPLIALAGCTADVEITEDTNATSGASVTYTSHLSGCHGKASTTIPSNGAYDLTSFGGPGDEQSMSCGGKADGKGWYAASRQRYGCGAKLMVQANNKCVVLATLDYGPDVCVENAAHSPILDVSPAASKILFNSSSAGWSDHFAVTVTEVSASTPLGPCASGDPTPPPPGDTTEGQGSGSGSSTSTPGAACTSSTLARDVDDGTCVQAATDSLWYQCDNGNWDSIASSAACSGEVYGFCASATLGTSVPARTCVQSASTSTWYQCNGTTWVSPVSTSTESGALGACSSWHAL